MANQKTLSEHAALVATGAETGTVLGLLTNTAGRLRAPRGSGGAGPAGNFALAATQALKHHARLGTAIGAGLTAAVGGPTVVAVAVAAAPFVGVAAVGALGY